MGIREGCFHGGGGLVEFAFEEPDAAEAGEDLGVGGSVVGEGGFVLGIISQESRGKAERRSLRFRWIGSIVSILRIHDQD